MKRILSLIIALFCIVNSNAQITILSNDLMDVGDSAILASVPIVPAGFNPGPVGPDQHWDFSGLVMDTVSQINFVDPATTPHGASFPGSNIAVEGMVEGLGLEGWAYGTKNTSLFQIDGAAGSYSIFENLVVPFNPPEVMFDFPVNYLDSLAQTTTIDLTIDSPEPTVDSLRIKIVTSLDSRVDAWGELITPAWSGEVLRFRDVRVTIDSAWAKLIFFWIFIETNTNTSITYKYMANDMGYPVMQFNADAGDTTFSMVDYLFDEGVGESELEPDKELVFDIYPNPASTHVYCRLQHAEVNGEINIYDMHGRQLYSKPVTSDQQLLEIDVSDYSAGLYQLVLQVDGRGVSSKKFVVR